MGDDDVENSYIKPEVKPDTNKTQELEQEIISLKEQIKKLEEKLDNFIKQFE
jgi:flagellar motility protein MotE (MotC chaperone)